LRRTTKNLSEQSIGVRKADGDSSPSLQKDQNDTNMLINDLSFAIRPFYDMIIARPLCLLEAFSRSVIKGQVARRVGLAHHFDCPRLTRCLAYAGDWASSSLWFGRFLRLGLGEWADTLRLFPHRIWDKSQRP
jgi:hypothetical protein